MVIAALVAFGSLLAAWLLAPAERRTRSRHLEEPIVQAHALGEAA
jgi:hypothetical protein